MNESAFVLLAFGAARGILYVYVIVYYTFYPECLHIFHVYNKYVVLLFTIMYVYLHYLCACGSLQLMMAFIHCTGGPNVVLTAHNGASRRASDTQVAFITDVVTPMPMVSIGLHCPHMHACQCQSLHHHAKQLNITLIVLALCASSP